MQNALSEKISTKNIQMYEKECNGKLVSLDIFSYKLVSSWQIYIVSKLPNFWDSSQKLTAQSQFKNLSNT